MISKGMKLPNGPTSPEREIRRNYAQAYDVQVDSDGGIYTSSEEGSIRKLSTGTESSISSDDDTIITSEDDTSKTNEDIAASLAYEAYVLLHASKHLLPYYMSVDLRATELLDAIQEITIRPDREMALLPIFFRESCQPNNLPESMDPALKQELQNVHRMTSRLCALRDEFNSMVYDASQSEDEDTLDEIYSDMFLVYAEFLGMWMTTLRLSVQPGVSEHLFGGSEAMLESLQGILSDL